MGRLQHKWYWVQKYFVVHVSGLTRTLTRVASDYTVRGMSKSGQTKDLIKP